MELRNAVQASFERMQNSASVRAGAAAAPSFLRALHIVYEQLEQQLQRSGTIAGTSASLEHVALRRQQLERELVKRRVDFRVVDKPALHALVLAQAIRREATAMATAHAEAVLIGYARALELAWQLQRDATLSRFEPQLEAAAMPAAISGACSGAEGLCRLLELFEERMHDRDQSVRFLNLEAGKHPIPRDLREVEAAVRAGEQTYREWPYYYARFGERGVRFTRSDSAWIAYIARGEERAAQSSFDWLARLLAARGMPRLLFEHHLGHLHEELVRAVPDHAADYDSLLRAAAKLHAARTGLLPDLELLARQFQPQRGATPPPLAAAEAGRLLVAAVLDEKLGIVNAVASLVSWLGDPARFGEDWARAVERCIEHARQAL